MNRIIISLILIVVIVAVGTFVAGRLGAKGEDDNWFNTSYRSKVSRSLLLRSVFSLHETGDAKADYLGDKYQNIQIEVDGTSESINQSEVLYQLADRIEALTGKPTSIYFSDSDVAGPASFTIDDLDALTAQYRANHSGGSTAVVYLLVLDQPPQDEDPTLLGMTHHEDEIILFTQALRDFTIDSTSTFANYELSTALHEFGHLLGLAHNEQAGCLMNARAEADHVPRYNAKDVITDFCDYEKALLKQ